MTIALDIQAVSKRFGALTAPDQVSLSVEAGEFFALLGPNGAWQDHADFLHGRFVAAGQQPASG